MPLMHACHPHPRTQFLLSRCTTNVCLPTYLQAYCRLSNEPVALKVYNMSRMPPLMRYQLQREVDLHIALAHPHIIKLYAAFQQGHSMVMVQVCGGDAQLGCTAS